jgi:hypothetical protein
MLATPLRGPAKGSAMMLCKSQCNGNRRSFAVLRMTLPLVHSTYFGYDKMVLSIRRVVPTYAATAKRVPGVATLTGSRVDQLTHSM